MTEIHWLGPYKWKCIFNLPKGKQAGVYIWTIPYRGKYLVYYVGETGRTFVRRFTEHTRDYLYGYNRVYDPRLFSQGTKQLVWGGMWKPGTRNRMGEFLKRYLELSPIIYDFMGLFRIFLGPLDIEKRFRQRVEAAIAENLYRQLGLIGEFQDGDIRYQPRKAIEEPIKVVMIGNEDILGMAGELLV